VISTTAEFPHIKPNARSMYNRKPVHGVGVNDANYQVSPFVDGKKIFCPFYATWMGMLDRCYSRAYQTRQPTYIGCTVVDEWLTFSNFRAWMVEQDWQGKQLDKDLLIPGNKIYGPNTCMFVTHAINSLLGDCKKSRGAYPIGVSWHKPSGLFTSSLSVFGVVKRKYFHSSKLTAAAYLKMKAAHIRTIANTEIEPLRSALLKHADIRESLI